MLIRLSKSLKETMEAVDLSGLKQKMKESDETAAVILRSMFGMYQIYFKRIYRRMSRIASVASENFQ